VADVDQTSTYCVSPVACSLEGRHAINTREGSMALIPVRIEFLLGLHVAAALWTSCQCFVRRRDSCKAQKLTSHWKETMSVVVKSGDSSMVSGTATVGKRTVFSVKVATGWC